MADLPPRSVLERRSTKAIAATLRRYGIRADLRTMEDGTVRAMMQLVSAPQPTANLIARTTEALRSKGQTQVALQLKDFVRSQSMAALGLTGKAGGEQQAVWIAVMDKATCDDCMERHGVSKTMAEWEAEGLPGSENLMCNGNCRCDFLRDDMVNESTVEEDIRVTLDIEVTRD